MNNLEANFARTKWKPLKCVSEGKEKRHDFSSIGQAWRRNAIFVESPTHESCLMNSAPLPYCSCPPEWAFYCEIHVQSQSLLLPLRPPYIIYQVLTAVCSGWSHPLQDKLRQIETLSLTTNVFWHFLIMLLQTPLNLHPGFLLVKDPASAAVFIDVTVLLGDFLLLCLCIAQIW